MKYYAISNNAVVELPACDTLQDAIHETSLYFKSSIFPAATVSEYDLAYLQKRINNLLDID